MTLFSIPTILVLSFLFTRSTHPLAMGLILLMQTILISVTSGITTYSFWFSYILFLIFLGGMLILFIYVASLASNEFFYATPTSFTLSMVMLTFILLSIFILYDPLMITMPSHVMKPTLTLSTSTPLMISWIYNSTAEMFTLFIVLFLLLTLIVVVKVTNLFKGPLRFSL